MNGRFEQARYIRLDCSTVDGSPACELSPNLGPDVNGNRHADVRRSCFHQNNARGQRRLPQIGVQSGEGQANPFGELQISGIVNGELMLGSHSDHGIPGGGSVRWLDADWQRSQIASKPGDPFEIDAASAHGHHETIHNFGRPVGRHDGRFTRAKTLK